MASIGIFDGVHLGHRSLLAQIGQYAGERSMYSAVVTFKEHPKHVLHPESALPLLNTPEERIEKLGEAGIDYVILLDFTEEIANLSAHDFLRLLSEKYHVKGIVIGYDHRFGHNRTEGFEQYAAIHHSILSVPIEEHNPMKHFSKTIPQNPQKMFCGILLHRLAILLHLQDGTKHIFAYRNKNTHLLS